MLILVTGASGSGKSSYAESLFKNLDKNFLKYYLATMRVYDKEGEQKVHKHRKMRDGKSFITIEQATDIEKAVKKMDKNPHIKRVCLLECMSNLVANEIFKDKCINDFSLVEEKILSGIDELLKNVSLLVIVTNNIFEDGITYDEITTNYIKCLANINKSLANIADKVIEVVVGLPVILKEEG